MNAIATGMAAGTLAGSALTMGGAKLASKISGKPMGAPGSIAHILTNDKLDKEGKLKVIAETNKEGLKDIAKLTGLAGATAGATALVTKCFNKFEVASKFSEMKHSIGNLLSKVSINGKNLKELVNETKLCQKFRNIPSSRTKFAILAGAAVLALATPIMSMASAGKAGYIEGKHETK